MADRQMTEEKRILMEVAGAAAIAAALTAVALLVASLAIDLPLWKGLCIIALNAFLVAVFATGSIAKGQQTKADGIEP